MLYPIEVKARCFGEEDRPQILGQLGDGGILREIA
jgi:hypothetical protein